MPFFLARRAFTAESWMLADRTDLINDLVLRHGFTVNWKF